MRRNGDFVAYVLETLEPFGEVRARPMFGGHGLYRGELMFALVLDDVLYLKSDGESAPLFLERGLDRFRYVKKGRLTEMSYFAAPEEMFDDPDEAVRWATHAWDAALRAARRRKKR